MVSSGGAVTSTGVSEPASLLFLPPTGAHARSETASATLSPHWNIRTSRTLTSAQLPMQVLTATSQVSPSGHSLSLKHGT